MIYIGTMNLTRTQDKGNFYCPQCTVEQTYRLRKRRPFLTLYFIPVIPIGGAEAFVQCDHCRQSWDVSVLQLDQETHQAALTAQFEEEAFRACVLVAISDGTISDAEIEVLLRIAQKVLHQQHVDREELGRLCSIAAENKIEANNYVLTVSRRWNNEQKHEAVKAMFLIASADPEAGDGKLKCMQQMQDTLDMTRQEYEKAVEDALMIEDYV